MGIAAQTVATKTLQGLAGYHLRRASRAVQADLARTLKPLGLRMITFSALTVIGENPGLSQSRLAGALDVERPNLVAIIDELAGAGWLRRTPAPEDRRAHALYLTAPGRAHLGRALAAVRAHEDRLFGGLDPADLSAIGRVARHLAGPKREDH